MHEGVPGGDRGTPSSIPLDGVVTGMLPEATLPWDRGRQQARRRRIFVAPMMDWTDRHCRYFLWGPQVGQ